MTMDVKSLPFATAGRARSKLAVRWVMTAAAMIILIPVAAACSGGSSRPKVASVDTTPASTSSTPGADRTSSGPSDKQSLLAYSQCMRGEGITNFPDPDANGSLKIDGSKLGIRPDSPQFKAADSACKQYLPNGGQPQAPPPGVEDALVKYAQCMRAHGISNFPDPNPNGGLALNGNEIDTNSPQFKAADEECKQYMPGGGKGGMTTDSGKNQ